MTVRIDNELMRDVTERESKTETAEHDDLTDRFKSEMQGREAYISRLQLNINK